MMKDKCPYCGKTHCVREVAIFNAESYGNIGINGYDLPCVHCGEMIYVKILKSVQVFDVEQSTTLKEDSDF